MKTTRYGIWCEPKDGSDNGKWVKRYGDPWLFFLIEEAIKEAVDLALGRWIYEAREFDNG